MRSEEGFPSSRISIASRAGRRRPHTWAPFPGHVGRDGRDRPRFSMPRTSRESVREWEGRDVCNMGWEECMCEVACFGIRVLY